MLKTAFRVPQFLFCLIHSLFPWVAIPAQHVKLCHCQQALSFPKRGTSTSLGFCSFSSLGLSSPLLRVASLADELRAGHRSPRTGSTGISIPLASRSDWFPSGGHCQHGPRVLTHSENFTFSEGSSAAAVLPHLAPHCLQGTL